MTKAQSPSFPSGLCSCGVNKTHKEGWATVWGTRAPQLYCTFRLSLISVPFCGCPVFVFSSFFKNPKFKKLLELQNIIFESHCIYF